MAFAAPTSTSELTYFPGQTTQFAQGADVNFAARAPPMAATNVAITGGVTVMQGSALALHGQKTVATLFGFSDDLIAPNRTLDVPGSTVDLNISQADLISIQSIQPGKSGTVTINGTSTLVTKGPDGKIIDATPINDLPTVALVPDPLQPPAPSDPWWAKAIKQLEGVMDDL